MMENDINIQDAARPPLGEVSIPTENVENSIPAGDLSVENAGNLSEGETILSQDMIPNKGLPSHGTTPVEDNTFLNSEMGEPTGETPVKEDPSRYEHWQSKYDRQVSETAIKDQKLQEAQEKLKHFENLQHIDTFLKSNPQALEQIQSLSDGQPAGLQNQQPSSQMPTRPQKPHTYNEVDAYNDPESESFKYRMSNEKYRDDMLDFQLHREQRREAEMIEYQRRQSDNAKMQQAYSHAQNAWGWDAAKAKDFVIWAKNPDSITHDILCKVFELSRAPSQQDSQVQHKMAQMDEQAERLQAPQTTTVQPGQSAPTLSDEQLFSNGLLNSKRR